VRHVHIVPKDDLIKHNIEESHECPCNPDIEINTDDDDGVLVLHCPMDGRSNGIIHPAGWAVYNTDTYEKEH